MSLEFGEGNDSGGGDGNDDGRGDGKEDGDAASTVVVKGRGWFGGIMLWDEEQRVFLQFDFNRRFSDGVDLILEELKDLQKDPPTSCSVGFDFDSQFVLSAIADGPFVW
ncbi:hypothetical protein AKJ16_DCAP01816 [Drosera capensis]